MTTPRPARSIEAAISTLLIVGVVLSIALIMAGMTITFLHHPDYVSSRAALTRLTQDKSFPHSLRSVLGGVQQLRGRALVMLGLLLLIATPVARVAASLYAFAREGDRVFVVLTAIVFTLLLVSFALGRALG